MEKKLTQQRLNSVLAEIFERFHTPSISVSVWDGEEALHSAIGMSDIGNSIKANQHTIYCIGSSTKAFTSTALCILAGEGRLKLDDPVKKHLPSFAAYDPYVTEHLTVRDILCHRCGLPRHDVTVFSREGCSISEMVEAIRYMKPVFPLRYTWSYQNHMFTLAGLLVETISGMPWGTFIQERILKPLHMDSSYSYGFNVEDALLQKARPYAEEEGAFHQIPYNYCISSAPAGSIFSTTEDMLKWLRFQLEGNEKIVPTELLRQTQTPQMLIKPDEFVGLDFPEINASAYGLGWFIYGYRGSIIVHHGGTIDGFRSQQIFMPGEHLAVSVLTNGNCSYAINALAYALLDVLLGKETADWGERFVKEQKKFTVMFEQEQKKLQEKIKKGKICLNPEIYVGSYQENAYGQFRVIKREDGMFMQFGSLTYPLIYMEKDRFLLTMQDLMMCFVVTFLRNEQNEITGMDIPLEEMLPEDPIHFERI